MYLIYWWLLLISLAVTLASAKKFTKCELANRLKSQSTPEVIRADYKTWVCIAYKHSDYNTNDVIEVQETKKNDKGLSKSFGLFHISKNHCSEDPEDINSRDKNDPCANCLNFKDDDITDDLMCVEKILKGIGNSIRLWSTHANGCIENECDVDECKNLNQCREDFWDEGACVFPRSCGKEGNGDVCYPCNNDKCASTTFKDLIVLKKKEVKCCGIGDFDPKRKRRALHGQGAFSHGGNNLGPVTHSGAYNQAAPVSPKLDPLFIGCDDPDFISDGCDRNEIQMEVDKKCYGVLSNGPCGIEGIVLVNKTSKKGFCAPRLCGPDRVFLAKTQRCHDPREPGLCERPDLILYTNLYGDPVCGCRNGFFEKDSKCHQILTETEICPKGEVFWFESFRKAPKCLPDPCKGQEVENINRPVNQLPFAPDKDGICHQIASKPKICRSDQFYFLNMEKLEGSCERLDDTGIIVYTAEEYFQAEELYGPFIPKGPSQSGPTNLDPLPPYSHLPLIPVISSVPHVILHPPPTPVVNILQPYSPVHNMLIPNNHHLGVFSVNGSVTYGAGTNIGYTGYHSGFSEEAAVESARKKRESPSSQDALPYKSHHRQTRDTQQAINIFGTTQNDCQAAAQHDSNAKCNHRVKRSGYATGNFQSSIPVNTPTQEEYVCPNQYWTQQRQCVAVKRWS